MQGVNFFAKILIRLYFFFSFIAIDTRSFLIVLNTAYFSSMGDDIRAVHITYAFQV